VACPTRTTTGLLQLHGIMCKMEHSAVCTATGVYLLEPLNRSTIRGFSVLSHRPAARPDVSRAALALLGLVDLLNIETSSHSDSGGSVLVVDHSPFTTSLPRTALSLALPFPHAPLPSRPHQRVRSSQSSCIDTCDTKLPHTTTQSDRDNAGYPVYCFFVRPAPLIRFSPFFVAALC